MHLAAYQTLQCSTKRFVTKYQSISINTRRKTSKTISPPDQAYWDSIISFVKPIMELHQVETSVCFQPLLQTGAEAVITIAWMHTESKLCDLKMIMLALSVLRKCLDKVMTDEATLKKDMSSADGKVVCATQDLFSREKLTLQTVIYAARCQVLLSKIGENTEIPCGGSR